ncbi:hypothetical protein NN561_015610 [Cricetulus griseus]
MGWEGWWREEQLTEGSVAGTEQGRARVRPGAGECSAGDAACLEAASCKQGATSKAKDTGGAARASQAFTPAGLAPPARPAWHRASGLGPSNEHQVGRPEGEHQVRWPEGESTS